MTLPCLWIGKCTIPGRRTGGLLQQRLLIWKRLCQLLQYLLNADPLINQGKRDVEKLSSRHFELRVSICTKQTETGRSHVFSLAQCLFRMTVIVDYEGAGERGKSTSILRASSEAEISDWSSNAQPCIHRRFA